MAFKLNPPYNTNPTPIYRVRDQDDTLGRATDKLTITINDKVKCPKLEKEIIAHEEKHIKDMKEGKLWYDDDYVYHRENTSTPFKKYKRSEMTEGDKSLPWEHA
jgi:hypothetical protein